MADNYLERQYDAFLAKKAAAAKAKKLAWQKQLKAYKAKLAAEKSAQMSDSADQASMK